MATDRFVYWHEKRPSFKEMEMALVDYLGEGIGRVEWLQSFQRWFVFIHGVSSHPQQRLLKDQLGPHVTMVPQRIFEVFWDEDNIDIITRDQGTIVSAIAAGFQQFCVEYWKADLEKNESSD